MEKDQLRSSALDNELELGAVAEAQVAQAEGLLQVAEAIKHAQKTQLKNLLWAATLAAFLSILGSCAFMYWQTENMRATANLALPLVENYTHAHKVAILKGIDWNKAPSEKNLKLRQTMTPEAKASLDRMIKAMKADPEGWISFIENQD